MRVIVRADASADIGTGHVLRCLALAEALDAGGHAVSLVSAALPDVLAARMAERGVPVHRIPSSDDLAATVAVSDAENADWVVLDHYGLGPTEAEAHRAAGRRVLVVDDLAAWTRYPADLVLNANAHARRSDYTGRADVRLLLGPRFALLRSEFAAFRDWVRVARPFPVSVLVTMGGTDPAGLTVPIVEELRRLLPETCRIVATVGRATRQAEAVRERLGRLAGVEVREAAAEMPDLMAAADLAVASAGSTSWELAFMQLPAAVVPVAENQRPVADSVVVAGAAVSFESDGRPDLGRLAAEIALLTADSPRRAAMAAAGRRLVDGRGAMRVVRAMEAVGISLREATMRDAELLFTWANDPVTRAASFQSDPIPWPDHRAWLERRLDDEGTLLYVAERESPVGQVRFDRASDEVAVISVSVAPAARGRGFAPAIIDAGVRAMLVRWPVRTIRAEIREDNAASLAAFADAGFGEPAPLADRDGAVVAWRDAVG